MPKIFISYRREDSEHVAGRIHDRLDSHFGREAVFMDVDAIPYGVDFREHLQLAVAQCDVLLAVIGENWLDSRFKDGPKEGELRLDDPGDFVRVEIHSALDQGIAVIPVLVGKAVIPDEQQLPDGLQALCYQNAAEVRSGRDFHVDMDRLIRGIEQLAQHQETLRQQEEQRRREQEKAEEKRRGREEERRRQEEDKRRREREEAERREREAEEKRRLRREEERRQQEVARLQQVGKEKLAKLAREALDRTGGKPAAEDDNAAKELCRRHHIVSNRARTIVAEVRSQWKKEVQLREAEEQRRRQEQLQQQQELMARQATNLGLLKDDGRLDDWVNSNLLGWDRLAWLELLGELMQSEFWPLPLNDLELLLKEIKRDKTASHLANANRATRELEVSLERSSPRLAIPVRGCWYSRVDDQHQTEWQYERLLPALVQIDPARAYLFGAVPETADADLSRLADMCSLPELKALQLAWSERITDKGLSYLKHLTQLRSLEVDIGHGVTNAGLAHLRDLGELRSLALHQCHRLDDVGLALLRPLRRLESLTLRGCRRMTDTGLQSLGSLDSLLSLALWGCRQITDVGLSCVQPLIRLRSLTIYQCPELTVPGLGELRVLNDLRELNIYRCCQIRTPEVGELRKQMPHCKIIIVAAPEDEALNFRRHRLAKSFLGREEAGHAGA